MATYSKYQGGVMVGRRWVFAIFTSMFVSGCATIPSEAPELSAQLGLRISAIEGAHVRLLEEFFLEKRRRVDEFIQKEWVPVFAQEIFSEPEIDAVWNQVVQSKNKNDKLEFISRVGPALQKKINAKRLEFIQPLDELESTIKNQLKFEYDQTKAMNNSITSFLHSASKVDENRKRYLDMIGIKDEKLEAVISKTDEAISDLVGAAKKIEGRVKDADAYRSRIKEIIESFRKKGA